MEEIVGFIDGHFVEVGSGERLPVIDPSTEEPVAEMAVGGRQDVDRAIEAATRALADWRQRGVEERCQIVAEIGVRLAARSEEVAVAISTEMGAPIGFSRLVQAGLPILTFQHTAAIGPGVLAPVESDGSLVRRQPAGVVGAITPWNYPLHQIAAKVAPALVAGCTVVLKPSELAPVNAVMLAQAVMAAGVPNGVFNLVPGTGLTVGEPLSHHGGLGRISFTGSVAVGRKIAKAAAENLVPTTLELGGKSALLVLDGLDHSEFAHAVRSGVASCLLNSGQTCDAQTRLIVPESCLGATEELAAAIVDEYQMGPALSEDTQLGPLVSAGQRDRVIGYLQQAVLEGARLVRGSTAPARGFDRGYFVEAAVLSDVTAAMTVAREEVFGPVLSILTYPDGDVDRAVALANGTNYGLGAAVYGPDLAAAESVAARLLSGQVHLNGATFNPMAPFGGVKHSGYGRELGRFGLEEMTVLQAIQR